MPHAKSLLLLWSVVMSIGCSSVGKDGIVYLMPPEVTDMGGENLDQATIASTDLPRITFTEQDCVTTPGSSSVAIAAIDAERIPDIVVSNTQSSTLNVFLNPLEKACPDLNAYPTGRSPSSLVVGDLDGNGLTDVIVATGGDNTVSVHLNDGEGVLRKAVPYPVAAATSLALGDIDGKGGPDLVALSSTADAVRVLYNQGDGTFNLDTTQYKGGRLLFSLALAPLQSATLDLVMASAGDNHIDVLKADGQKRFATPQTIGSDSLLTPVAVVAADLNRDNKPDLVVPSHNNDQVVILLNQGNYVFTSHAVAVGRHPVAVAVADLTRDGLPDIAVVNAGDDTLQIITRTRLGEYATNDLLKFKTDPQPVAVAAGDLNIDDVPDLVVVHREGRALKILYTNTNN